MKRFVLLMTLGFLSLILIGCSDESENESTSDANTGGTNEETNEALKEEKHAIDSVFYDYVSAINDDDIDKYMSVFHVEDEERREEIRLEQNEEMKYYNLHVELLEMEFDVGETKSTVEATEYLTDDSENSDMYTSNKTRMHYDFEKIDGEWKITGIEELNVEEIE